jgi:hypothetical protein
MRSPDDSGWILVQECMMIALIHRLHDIVLPLRRWGSRPRVYNHVHVRVKCANANVGYTHTLPSPQDMVLKSAWTLYGQQHISRSYLVCNIFGAHICVPVNGMA